MCWVGGHHLHNHTTSWLHLASWNLPDSQLSWESKVAPSMAILSPVQTGNRIPHDEYNKHSIRMRCVCIFLTTCTFTKHTRNWTYSTLQYFFATLGSNLGISTLLEILQSCKLDQEVAWFSTCLPLRVAFLRCRWCRRHETGSDPRDSFWPNSLFLNNSESCSAN